MRIREAILKAADSIEQNPTLFRFSSVDIPGECGSPGCALGWIAHHVGWVENGRRFLDGIASVMGEDSPEAFYTKMDDLEEGGWWGTSAYICAASLRLYADKYHPETDSIPASVRAIFDVPELVNG